ncbi:MAG: SAM-dependent DNA methyltransferase [Anaerolineales bacterium]|nr:SAM-dependent DNA methyltransferase [Anaerolineales bacterium]
MELSTLQNWLWRAACSIRGAEDAAKYKDYILPLIFFKRLSDVFEDELAKLARQLDVDIPTTELLVADDRKLIRFYLSPEMRWNEIRKNTTNLGETLTDILRQIARENPKLQGVIDRRDFNATEQGQRVLDDDILAGLIEILSEYRLGLKDVEPDIIGRAYEYLIRKFAERGSSAGEFFTPTEVGFLISRILDPQPGDTIYDPASGSGGLLIKAQLRHREKLATASSKSIDDLSPEDDPLPVHLYGQEYQADNIAAARMNAFIHDMDAEILRGDTIRNPLFLDGGSLRKFHKVAANPMWNQNNFAESVYENDTFGRFINGIPPINSADWGWIQHMFASLLPGGKMAVVLDTGAVARGSGNKGANRERDIRKAFIEADRIDAVVLLPENLFFNTSAPGVIMVIHRTTVETPRAHADEILLINANKMYEKGNPKNFMTELHINQIGEVYLEWREVENLSKAVKRTEVIRNDYNVSPSRYVSHSDVEPALPLEEALVRLQEAEEARKEADRKLDSVMEILGFVNWREFDSKVNNNDAE